MFVFFLFLSFRSFDSIRIFSRVYRTSCGGKEIFWFLFFKYGINTLGGTVHRSLWGAQLWNENLRKTTKHTAHASAPLFEAVYHALSNVPDRAHLCTAAPHLAHDPKESHRHWSPVLQMARRHHV
jgi:hypothetical protein